MSKPAGPKPAPDSSAWISRFNFDLRNGLNALLSAATLLNDTSMDSEQAQLVSVIEKEGADLRNRINQLIDLNDIESGRAELEEAEIFVPTLIEELVDLYRVQAADRDLVLRAQISRAGSRWIQCDPGRLRQVMINLVENAVLYSSPGEVRVAAGRSTGNVIISVRDEGPGMPQALVAAINGEATDDTSAEPGLGIYVAMKGAALLGGRLVAKASSEGTQISLILPGATVTQKQDPGMNRLRQAARETQVRLANPGAEAETGLNDLIRDWGLGRERESRSEARAILVDPKPAEITQMLAETEAEKVVVLCTSEVALDTVSAAEHPSAFIFRYPESNYRLLRQILLPQHERERAGFWGKEGHGGRRVLVVDDSVANQMVTASMCRKLGHRVTTVSSGREAIQTAKQVPFDVILMDIQMPGMNGIEAAREIQRDAVGENAAPLIAVTANTLSVDREACESAGMVDYLTKPVDREKLKQTIEHWGTRTQTLRDQEQLRQLNAIPVFEAGDLKRLEKEVDRSIIPEIAAAFFKEAKVRLAQIRLALAEERAEDIARHAHPIKSAAKSFGARRLFQWSQYLETAGKAGNRRAIEAVFDDVESCLARTRELLMGHVEDLTGDDS
ncbi:MAG: response regulator [Pseudomonadota bacterium]